MSLGCPQCGTLTGVHHIDCTWEKDHPTTGQIIMYEYAGFKFQIRDVNGGVSAEALPGQHPAAYKDKHLRAALESYAEDVQAGKFGAFRGSVKK